MHRWRVHVDRDPSVDHGKRVLGTHIVAAYFTAAPGCTGAASPRNVRLP
jgi:hypothetical protein